MRNFLVPILAWFADLERRNISERGKALRKRKQDGKHLGRNFKEPDRMKYSKIKSDNPNLKTAQIARFMAIPQVTLYRWVGRWNKQDKIKRNRQMLKRK